MAERKSIKKSLRYVFQSGVATSAMDTLAVGPTLITYATFFGAGNIAFGILGAIPYIGNLIHLFVGWLVEKGFSVRKISFWSSFLSRPFYLFAALLAFNPNMPGALFLLILFLTASYLIGCMAGGAYQPWMKVLIPEKLMGRFFSFRFKYMMLAKIICFLGASYLLKYIHEKCPENDIYGYSALLTLAFLIGLYGACILLKIQECQIPTHPEKSFIQKLKLSIENKPFQSLLKSLSILNFSQAFITPFVTVFMLKRFNIAISVILILNLIMQIVYMLTIKKWGKLADTKGTDKILLYSIPLFISVLMGVIVLNFIAIPNIYLIYTVLIILHILLGTATSGLALGMNNASLLFVPNQMAAVFLSVNSTIKSFAGALGSLTAGAILTYCIEIEKILGANTLQAGWTSFYTLAILLCLLAAYLIKHLQARIYK